MRVNVCMRVCKSGVHAGMHKRVSIGKCGLSPVLSSISMHAVAIYIDRYISIENW